MSCIPHKIIIYSLKKIQKAAKKRRVNFNFHIIIFEEDFFYLSACCVESLFDGNKKSQHLPTDLNWIVFLLRRYFSDE
jgi:hypothetical protein